MIPRDVARLPLAVVSMSGRETFSEHVRAVIAADVKRHPQHGDTGTLHGPGFDSACPTCGEADPSACDCVEVSPVVIIDRPSRTADPVPPGHTFALAVRAVLVVEIVERLPDGGTRRTRSVSRGPYGDLADRFNAGDLARGESRYLAPRGSDDLPTGSSGSSRCR